MSKEKCLLHPEYPPVLFGHHFQAVILPVAITNQDIIFNIFYSFIHWRGTCHVAGKILVPDQGSNLCPLQWEHSLNQWTTREIPGHHFHVLHTRGSSRWYVKKYAYLSNILALLCTVIYRKSKYNIKWVMRSTCLSFKSFYFCCLFSWKRI